MTTQTPADKNALPPVARDVSIRRALMVSFTAIIVLLALTLLALLFLDRRQARTDLANVILERALARTNSDLSELLAPVRRQLAIDWHEVRMGGMPRDDAAAHARHFLPAMLELPIVGSMMVADSAGHQMLLMRWDSTVIASPLLAGRTNLPPAPTGSRQYFTRDFSPAVRGDRSVWQLWNGSARRTDPSWTVPMPGYEPMRREWHTRAVERLAQDAAAAAGPSSRPPIAWTDVYTLFTTREPGISASFAARDPSGRLVVVAYDILLDAISAYTREQSPTPKGRVFVLTDSGGMIGHPRDTRFEDRVARMAVAMLPPEGLDDPALSAWAVAWRTRTDDSPTVVPLTISGARWWGGFRSLELEPGRRFWIGALVPETDVRASMGSQGIGIILATLLALLVALLMADVLARRLAVPLGDLAEQSARISRLELDTPRTPVSQLREVRQLGAAVEGMRLALQENFAERANAARALDESEARLRQSQKLDAVGQLAGGVAHDFNNLLTAIRGYAELLRARLASDAEGLDDLDEIESAAERASDLTTQLLAFSRRQHVEPRVVDVNAEVSSAGKMLRRLLGEHIAFTMTLDPDLPAVRIDPSQLHQVLVNLAVNARDAMPDGGRLTIRTSRREGSLASRMPGDGVGPALPSVIISVVDDGAGMTADVRARAFEPFFTTKERGRGTGLGLATCWGIVSDANGLLELESVPGEGTTASVVLPGVADPITAEFPVARPISTRSAGERVLVVEDEAQLRALAERALVRAGFVVHTAADGLEALELLNRERPMDLVVTDVVMPRMGGPALARALRAEQPGIRVLYMSGYADAAAFGSEGLPASAGGILRKPYTPSDLVRRVRAALDGAHEA